MTSPSEVPASLPAGWSYDGIAQSAHPGSGGAQAHCATRWVGVPGGGRLQLRLELSNAGALFEAAHVAERWSACAENTGGHVLVSRPEMARLMADAVALQRQVRELQQALTMKEELLRAHRRHAGGLDEKQQSALTDDLEQTKKSVQERYGLE